MSILKRRVRLIPDEFECKTEVKIEDQSLAESYNRSTSSTTTEDSINVKVEDQSLVQSYNLLESFALKEEFKNIKVESDHFERHFSASDCSVQI